MFNGNITLESDLGIGTKFMIVIELSKYEDIIQILDEQNEYQN